MPLIELDNAGVIGLVKDLKRSVMPVEAWDTLINVRCRENVLQSIGSNEDAYNVDEKVINFLLEVRNPVTPHWVLASKGKIYQTVPGSIPLDITKVATTYAGSNDSVWSGVDFHENRIMNVDSGSDLPQQINNALSNFVDLPDWPAATYCKWITAYKNFLIAFNITDGASSFPSRCKWSDLADTGQLPGSWDETDPATLSGENDIMAEGGGEILSSRILNDVMYIYKDNAIWFLYPSNDIYVFNFKQMEDRQGILGSHAITSYQGNHYLVIPGDVVRNNGQKLSSIIDKTNRNFLFDNIHATYLKRTQIVANYKQGELWICFANQSSVNGRLNEALIWNVMEKTWSQRELNDFSYLASGIIDTSGVSQIIDDDMGIIDLDNSIIDSINYNPAIESIMTARPGEEGIINLLTRPEEFDHVDWVNTGTPIVIANTTIAPDGTMTGDSIEDDDLITTVESRTQSATINPALIYTASIHILKDTISRAIRFSGINLKFFGSTVESNILFLDTLTGEFLIDAGTTDPSAVAIVESNSNWWRIGLTVKSQDGANTSAQISVVPCWGAGVNWLLDGSIGGTAIFWGAQLEQNTIMTPYDPVPKLFKMDGMSGILPNGQFIRQGLTMVGRDRFGQWKHSAASTKLVTRIYPKFTGSGSFRVYVGFSDTVDGAVTWSNPEIYTIGGLGHVDFLQSGTAIALRIEAIDNIGWQYSGSDIQVEIISENTT